MDICCIFTSVITTKGNNMKALNNITTAMNRLEVEIARQQNYISQHDKGQQDAFWTEYRADAERNLQIWDSMKVQRDELKRQAA